MNEALMSNELINGTRRESFIGIETGFPKKAETS